MLVAMFSSSLNCNKLLVYMLIGNQLSSGLFLSESLLSCIMVTETNTLETTHQVTV